MIPHALDFLDEWRAARGAAGGLFLGLDFDGTLAPIVPRPEDAVMLPAAAEVLARLVSRPDTDVAVVSGRGLADVRGRVALEGIWYAGNHGLEIEGPGLRRLHPEAAAVEPALRACARALVSALAEAAGVQVEDKGLTLSVHYRRAEDEATGERVRAAVARACEDGAFHVTEGKKVVEIRPAVDWDKGRATAFLLDVVEGARSATVPALFVGDDRTDEDAFRALEGHGAGVLVSASPPSDTAATAFLRGPEEVVLLLEGLARDA